MRFIVTISYNGTNYNGWQKLSNNHSIQGEIEHALSNIADEPILVYASGRTDAGTHATYQVVHFDCEKKRNIDAWLRGTNSYLPKDIRINTIQPLDSRFELDTNDNWQAQYPVQKVYKSIPAIFHARFSALSRRYRYFIYNGKVMPALLSDNCYWYEKRLDDISMNEAIKCIFGEHDFSSFRDSECQSISRKSNVMKAFVKRSNDWIIFDIKANAFLKHMVRNIVGSLMLIGLNKKPVSWFKKLLYAKNRSIAGPIAPSKGLYLISVEYPKHYKITDPTTLYFQLPQID